MIVTLAAFVLVSFEDSVVLGSPCPGFPQETSPRETAATSALIYTQNALSSSSNNIIEVADVDSQEAAGAGNARTKMLTNQSAEWNKTGVEYLSIQTAQSGAISQVNGSAYTLELNDVANRTIMFSDRPDRIVESVSTTDFVGNWIAGQDSFSADEPNDALIVENTQTGNLETVVIESSNPVYNMTSNTLTYTIMGENGTSVNLPSEFGHSILVIDNQACLNVFI